ncbi:hypothetical protein F4820DRAFT_177385 [Hypoxylon rubiginosum]|uniref:Uncharacterized protein n=1 Tax=Hypoxylon rubiginosum TaxID=110542 RepID=A0ACB9YJB9_9PEZI|nr:hypothetical protein F4820DRAFT_177385 [Hypoxylon rubiginosum]
MSSRGLSLREKTSYIPDIPSPLNPSSSELPLGRCRRCRVARSEQSPTQKLMRHKAAVAWRSMASREVFLKARIQSTRDEICTNMTNTNEQGKEDAPLIHTTAAVAAAAAAATDHSTLALPVEKYEKIDLGVRNVDTEKQGPVSNDYRDISLETSSYLSHLLTTRRLATAVGFVLFIGILSAVRAVGRVQAWRTR